MWGVPYLKVFQYIPSSRIWLGFSGMCGLSDAIVGFVSAILGGEELSLTSVAPGLFLSWTTPGSISGEVGLVTAGIDGGSTFGGEVDIDDEDVWPAVNKPLLKFEMKYLHLLQKKDTHNCFCMIWNKCTLSQHNRGLLEPGGKGGTFTKIDQHSFKIEFFA